MNAFAKILIEGQIEVKTGLHIGGSSAFAAIGATDSPVIRDPLTHLPLIPGSSLKGKMRSLLAKFKNRTVAVNPGEDDDEIKRLFGGGGENLQIGRLIFRDALLNNSEELVEKGARTLTEVKFENTIDRRTAEAKPRQIERVIPGSTFDLAIIYDVDNVDELEEDFEYIREGFKLLEWDYLGGHGSRGYGRIAFYDLEAKLVYGDLAESSLKKVNEIISSRESL